MLARCSPTLLSHLRSLAAATAAGIRTSSGAAAGNTEAAHSSVALADAGSARLPVDGLTLQHFLRRGAAPNQHEGPAASSAVAAATAPGQPARLAYIETYGW